MVAYLLLSLVGCSGRPSRKSAAAEPFQQGPFVLVETSDFPDGDATHGRSSESGSKLLQALASFSKDIRDFTQSHGIPDAVAMPGAQPPCVDFAYLKTGTVYSLRGSTVVAERPLTEAEAALIGPEARAQKLRKYIDSYARLLKVAGRVMRHLPADAASPIGGTGAGFFTVRLTPASAHLFTPPTGASGLVIAWVDPEGPAASQLKPGDLIIARNGAAPATTDDPYEAPTNALLTIVSGGSQRSEMLVADTWPRRVRFVLVDSTTPLALADAAVVTFTTRMVSLLEADDELAVLVGHELAHITRGHEARKAKRAIWEGVLAIGLAPVALVPGAGLLTQAFIKGLEGHYSRDQEREADRLGIRYANAAGYRADAAITLMRRLEEAAPSQALAPFLDSHPPYPERIDEARKVIAELKAHTP